jgi:hypothetical protein
VFPPAYCSPKNCYLLKEKIPCNWSFA